MEQNVTVNLSLQIGWKVIGSYIKSGSLWLFLLTVVSHLGLIGSQAMANIWLCMWTDTSNCMPATWRGGHNHTDIPVPTKVEVYGIIGAIQGLSNATSVSRGVARNFISRLYILTIVMS